MIFVLSLGLLASVNVIPVSSCLKVSFDKINGKKNPKDYTVKDVDVNWIYERTKMLYDIAIDIIFNNILGYSDYKFEKHF